MRARATSAAAPRAWVLEAAQVVRFGFVGVAATACHYALALALATAAGVPVQIAHIGGFLGAVPVSFLGHYHWTFKSSARYGRAARRFLAVAVGAFAVSAVVLQALAMLTTWEAWAAILVSVFVIPAASYVINRLFVF